MKRQVGRCTAAYESKRFPYFTINKPRSFMQEGNHGGVIAFFERCKFVRKFRLALELMEVVVTTDCEFQVHDDESVDALAHFILVEYENERLSEGLPYWDIADWSDEIKWDLLPFDFRTDWIGGER